MFYYCVKTLSWFIFSYSIFSKTLNKYEKYSTNKPSYFSKLIDCYLFLPIPWLIHTKLMAFTWIYKNTAFLRLHWPEIILKPGNARSSFKAQIKGHHVEPFQLLSVRLASFLSVVPQHNMTTLTSYWFHLALYYSQWFMWTPIGKKP